MGLQATYTGMQYLHFSLPWEEKHLHTWICPMDLPPPADAESLHHVIGHRHKRVSASSFDSLSSISSSSS